MGRQIVLSVLQRSVGELKVAGDVEDLGRFLVLWIGNDVVFCPPPNGPRLFEVHMAIIDILGEELRLDFLIKHCVQWLAPDPVPFPNVLQTNHVHNFLHDRLWIIRHGVSWAQIDIRHVGQCPRGQDFKMPHAIEAPALVCEGEHGVAVEGVGEPFIVV